MFLKTKEKRCDKTLKESPESSNKYASILTEKFPLQFVSWFKFIPGNSYNKNKHEKRVYQSQIKSQGGRKKSLKFN